MLRTHHCGELNAAHCQTKVVLCGWLYHIRKKGRITWFDLRDRYGVTQVVAEKEKTPKALFDALHTLNREDVLRVEGAVILRSAKNDRMPTGAIEVVLEQLEVISRAKLPPLLIENKTDAAEEIRMRYRYLDLRRPIMQANMLLRHRLLQCMRAHLNEASFLEIETPTLINYTPGGAKNFFVPSRRQSNTYHTLPQSPQIFKQLLMIGGFDAYYQVARCYRDEDPRADRQPEFTQLDCELSFVTREDIFTTFERLIQKIFSLFPQHRLSPFRQMTYQEAMQQYGTDKPDLRYPAMPIVDLSEGAKGAGFSPFDTAACVRGVLVPGGAQKYSRKRLDALEKVVAAIGAVRTVYMKMEESPVSSLSRFFSTETLGTWAEKVGAVKGDLLVLLAGTEQDTQQAAIALRSWCKQDIKADEEGGFYPIWVIDFPLFERSENEDPQLKHAYQPVHHPFTKPIDEDVARLEDAPLSVRADAYDLVINGVEVGGGSIRIADATLQEKIFDMLGLNKAGYFDFFLHALQYGTPPHGGIAFGIDRLCTLLAQGNSIRDFIPFPKTSAGRDLMTEAPFTISKEEREVN